ncbi:MAG: hypothetical protein HFJ12_06050 [Bacilli bacterium]|nr:hypothetical protein [Bacilli bacterium]
MNIILHNYKKVIEKIIKDCILNNIQTILQDFDYYSINNFINLLSNFDQSLNVCFKQAFIEFTHHLDKAYSSSIERKCKYHIKQKCPRTILTIFGEITYERTFYKSKLNSSCYCHVDRILGLLKYDYFDPFDYVSNHNYSETAGHLNILIGNRISIKQKYLSR